MSFDHIGSKDDGKVAKLKFWKQTEMKLVHQKLNKTIRKWNKNEDISK